MIRTYHNGRFEWFVIATVIALISVVALSRYWFMAEDARILRMEILAHRFVTAAANARIEFWSAVWRASTMQMRGKLPLPIAWYIFRHKPGQWR